MNCCDEYGNCRQGRDCPVRRATPTDTRSKYPLALVATCIAASAAVSLSTIYGLLWLVGVV